MSKAPSIIFAGTPDFASEHLLSLLDHGLNVCAVLTQPDRPAGRGRKVISSPVKQLANEHNIPVLQPQSLKDNDIQEELKTFQADLMVVVAYGLILPKAVLDMPKYGCINVHASILPRWRGAAPIQRAIEAGDRHSGISIMQMDVGLDTGPVYVSNYCDILPDDTGSILHDRLAAMGYAALPATIEGIVNGTLNAEPQSEEGVCYAHKLSKKEALIDWHLEAKQIFDKIRAFNAWPVAFSFIDGTQVKIWQSELTNITSQEEPGSIIQSDKHGIVVACGDSQALRLTELQLAGGKRMSANALLNSKKALFAPSQRFSNS